MPALIAFIMETRGLNARGWAVTPDAFRPGELPAHLSMNFKLVDEHGRQLDMRRNLTELRAEWGGQAKTEFAEKHEAPSEFSGLTDWTFGELPELMEVEVGGQMLLGYPGLTDDGGIRFAEGLRFTRGSARRAREGAGAAVQDPVQGAAQILREEPARPAADGHPGDGPDDGRRTEAATDRHRLRPRLPDGAAAANGSAVPYAQHRGEVAARPARRKSVASSVWCSPNGRR